MFNKHVFIYLGSGFKERIELGKHVLDTKILLFIYFWSRIQRNYSLIIFWRVGGLKWTLICVFRNKFRKKLLASSVPVDNCKLNWPSLINTPIFVTPYHSKRIMCSGDCNKKCNSLSLLRCRSEGVWTSKGKIIYHFIVSLI